MTERYWFPPEGNQTSQPSSHTHRRLQRFYSAPEFPAPNHRTQNLRHRMEDPHDQHYQESLRVPTDRIYSPNLTHYQSGMPLTYNRVEGPPHSSSKLRMGPSAVKNDFPHDSKRLSSLDGSSFRKGFPKPEDEITVVVIPATPPAEEPRDLRDTPQFNPLLLTLPKSDPTRFNIPESPTPSQTLCDINYLNGEPKYRRIQTYTKRGATSSINPPISLPQLPTFPILATPTRTHNTYLREPRYSTSKTSPTTRNLYASRSSPTPRSAPPNVQWNNTRTSRTRAMDQEDRNNGAKSTRFQDNVVSPVSPQSSYFPPDRERRVGRCQTPRSSRESLLPPYWAEKPRLTNSTGGRNLDWSAELYEEANRRLRGY